MLLGALNQAPAHEAGGRVVCIYITLPKIIEAKLRNYFFLSGVAGIVIYNNKIVAHEWTLITPARFEASQDIG